MNNKDEIFGQRFTGNYMLYPPLVPRNQRLTGKSAKPKSPATNGRAASIDQVPRDRFELSTP